MQVLGGHRQTAAAILMRLWNLLYWLKCGGVKVRQSHVAIRRHEEQLGRAD